MGDNSVLIWSSLNIFVCRYIDPRLQFWVKYEDNMINILNNSFHKYHLHSSICKFTYKIDWEETNANFIFFGLTRSRLEPTLYHIRGDPKLVKFSSTICRKLTSTKYWSFWSFLISRNIKNFTPVQLFEIFSGNQIRI